MNGGVRRRLGIFYRATPAPERENGSLEDLCRAVAAREVDLVRAGAVGLLVEVHEEVLIERVAAVGLAQQPGQPSTELRVELVVPGGEQGVAHVHALPVEG